MPSIVEFGLTYINRKINWNNVEKEFGKEEVEKIKNWREILGNDETF